MRLILLLAVVFASVSISHAQAKTSHATALLDTLTNAPAGFRLVFHRSDVAGDSSFYEIVGQSNFWRGKYAAQLADLDNPKVNIQGGSLPNRQWMIKGQKTNDWNRA